MMWRSQLISLKNLTDTMMFKLNHSCFITMTTMSVRKNAKKGATNVVLGLMTNWKESVIFIVWMHAAHRKQSKLMITISYLDTDVLVVLQQKINALAALQNWSKDQRVVHLLLLQMTENQIIQIQLHFWELMKSIQTKIYVHVNGEKWKEDANALSQFAIIE